MIFENATILTMNPKREVIEHGAVVIEGKRIAAVGKTKEIVAQHPQLPRINCNGNLLLPGLIDTHVHLAQCILRGYTDDKKFEFLDWLTGRIFPILGNMTPEDGLASASLCVLEMIKSGTTGFIEVLLAEHYGFDGIAKMIEEAGIRAALGKIVMDMDPAIRDQIGIHPSMWEPRQVCIQNTLKMFDRWNGTADGRIQVWFGARTAGEWNRPDLYDEISQLARERNMGITIHFAETPDDVAYAKTQGFRSPTEFGMAHGILGPRTVLAHYIHSDEEDWKLLVETGTTVSHNPGSNQREPWGPAPVARMLKAGVNVSMGCDAAVANNAMDMVRDLRVALHATRILEHDQAAMAPETALELATINGAKAMGIEDQVGSIEPGKHADFILIDLDKPHLQPVWNPIATLVLSALGSDVDTVVVDGKIIMQGRKVLTMDEEAILADIRQRRARLAEKAGIEMRLKWPVL